MYNSLGIEKELPAGLVTSLQTVQTQLGPLTILTVFCNKKQKEQIVNKATSIGMPHERFPKGIKLFN